MNEQWLKLTTKFDALNRRERIMVMMACIVILAALLNSLLIDPVARQIKDVSGTLANDQTQMALAQQQLQVFNSQPPVDPDTPNRQRLASIGNQLREVNGALDAMQQSLVSPDRMAGLLEDILKKNGQLKLVTLKSIPAGGVSAATDTAVDKSRAPMPDELAVYRHGVELTIQGNYLDLMHYLATLEKLPWHMLWGSMKLDANASAGTTLTLTIYTLSLDQAWLSI